MWLISNGTWINDTCCCHSGESIPGEWPKFQCPECYVHVDLIMTDGSYRDCCGNHKRVRDGLSPKQKAKKT